MGEVINFKDALASSARARQAPSVPDHATEFSLSSESGDISVVYSGKPDGSVHFKVIVPAGALDPVLAQAQARLAASFGAELSDELLDLIRDQIGQEEYDSYLRLFVQDYFFEQAYRRVDVFPFLSPDYLTGEAPVKGHDYTFEAECLLRPSFELSSYDPVSVSLPEKQQVSSKDVSAYLDNMAQELSTWEKDPAATTVESGSHVCINLDSNVNGRPFPQLCGRHIPFVVGVAQLGEDFDRQLVGMKPGQRKEFSISLPIRRQDSDASSEDRTAKDSITYQVVQVKVQIDEILHSVAPRIDDAWVMKNMPEAQTLLGLRSMIRSMLERAADRAYHDELMALCADELARRLVGEPDERYVEKMCEETVQQVAYDLRAQGLSLNDLMGQPDFDFDQWDQHIKDDARAALRRDFALDALATYLEIALEPDDLTAIAQQKAPGRENEFLSTALATGQMLKLCDVALHMRANEWLVDNLCGSAGRKTVPGVPGRSGASATFGMVDGGAGTVGAAGARREGSQTNDRPTLTLL